MGNMVNGGWVKLYRELKSKSIWQLSSPEQKVVLNRKGNIFFNQGKILEARRLFITTGYSDGLNRVAAKSMEEGKELDALKLYLLAHNKREAEPLIEKLANIISSLL